MQCAAHLRDGSGKRCRKSAKLGMTVCGSHGGSAPQVERKAAERLAQARDMALALLVEQITGKVLKPETALDATEKLSRLVELLEGRATSRQEQKRESDVDRELERAVEELRRRA